MLNDQGGPQQVDYLRIVAHEIRNPLAVIQGNASLLGRRLKGDEFGSECVEEVLDGCLQIQRTLDNIVAMAQEGIDESTLGPVPLVDLVDEALASFAKRYRSRHFGRISESDAVVHASRKGLEIVLHNLLSNAVKYSPATQPVEVAIDETPDSVTIMVLDRGPGVPEEERERIFAPFYRVAGQTAGVAGLGVGLNVVRLLTAAMGGESAFRPREDGGSAFSVRLRRASGQALPLAAL